MIDCQQKQKRCKHLFFIITILLSILYSCNKLIASPYSKPNRIQSNGILNRVYYGSNYHDKDQISPLSLTQNSYNYGTANYLNAAKRINECRSKYQGDEVKDEYNQAALVYNSFIENNSTFISLITDFYGTREIPQIRKEGQDALDYIKEQSTDKQVVIINEQHWQPKHRYLGNTLLQYYYDLGFRYFAVEGVSIEDEIFLNERKFPLQSSGFYTREPQFGNMLRNALDIGFYVVGYDSMCMNREYIQAQNIYDKCLKVNTTSKVLIWAGVDHIIEEKNNNPRMAYYLKQISGINPLTIQQTQGDYYVSGIGKSNLAIYEHPNPKSKDKCDIFLCNNYKEIDYRINSNAEQVPVKIELSASQLKELRQHKELLLSVFYKNEFALYKLDCVPVVNRLITDMTPLNIYLPRNKDFKFIIRTPMGHIIN